MLFELTPAAIAILEEALQRFRMVETKTEKKEIIKQVEDSICDIEEGTKTYPLIATDVKVVSTRL